MKYNIISLKAVSSYRASKHFEDLLYACMHDYLQSSFVGRKP